MTPEIICLEYEVTDVEPASLASSLHAAEYKDFLNAAQRISAKPLKFIKIHKICEVICAGCMEH